MGNALFAEIEDVFARQAPFVGCTTSAEDRTIVLDAFFSRCRWVSISYIWRPNLRDEPDNHIIELAVAGGAEMIVTQNLRDFRSGDLAFPGLNIVSPGEALKLWDEEDTNRWRP